MTLLLVASAGGHLKELHLLARRLPETEGRRIWVTWDTIQSRSLLAGEEVVHVPAAQPRDLVAAVATTRAALGVLRRIDVSCLVTTGSAPAVSFLPLARARGIPCHFVESITRTTGPSFSARLCSVVPGVHLYTQNRAWASARWAYAGSVLDDFEGRSGYQQGPLRRVVVTVGTSKRYGFRALIERLVAILPPEVEVLWQTGSTDVTGLGINARPLVPADELDRAMADADVVVAHAGAGSTLGALEAGRLPVLVPRRRARGEHVDDHQVAIGDELASRRLAIVRSPDALVLADLEEAASRLVVRTGVAVPLHLAR